MTPDERFAVRFMLPYGRHLLSDLVANGITLATLERLTRAGLISPVGYWHLTRAGRDLQADMARGWA